MELCPKCRTALFIERSYLTVSGDESEQTDTVITHCMEQVCKNAACENCGRVVDIIRTVQPFVKGESTP